MAYLIDTNIIIYAVKHEPQVRDNFSLHANEAMGISLITYAELLYGAKKSAHPTKNLDRVAQIKNLFPLVPLGLPVIEIFSDLKARQRKIGIVIDDADLLLAATALAYNYTLVTNNTRHFTMIDDLPLENWRAPA